MKKKVYQAFTLVEMMIVLLIISVLVLLFIPNLSQEKEKVVEKGDQAIVQTIKTQIELAEFDQAEKLTEAKILELLKGDAKKIALYEKYIKGK